MKKKDALAKDLFARNSEGFPFPERNVLPEAERHKPRQGGKIYFSNIFTNVVQLPVMSHLNEINNRVLEDYFLITQRSDSAAIRNYRILLWEIKKLNLEGIAIDEIHTELPRLTANVAHRDLCASFIACAAWLVAAGMIRKINPSASRTLLIHAALTHSDYRGFLRSYAHATENREHPEKGRRLTANQIMKDHLADLLRQQRPTDGWGSKRAAASSLLTRMDALRQETKSRLSRRSLEKRLADWMTNNPVVASAFKENAAASRRRRDKI